MSTALEPAIGVGPERVGAETSARLGAAADPLPTTIIEPRSGWRVVDLGELWRAREILLFLTWRDIKVRYQQTVLGAAWAVLQPLATMMAFSLFIRKAAGAVGSDVPYPLFVFAGLLPWTFFANALGSAGQSIVSNHNLVTKIYLPRLLIPLSAVAAGLADFAVAGALMVFLMLYYGVLPGWGILWVPPIVAGLVAATMGVGTLLAALTVRYRDFRHVIPFMTQIWMFCTPSIYLQAGDAIGHRAQLLLPLNPPYGLIANFRQAMLGRPLDYYSLAVSGMVSLLLLLLGAFYFRKSERRFADVI